MQKRTLGLQVQAGRLKYFHSGWTKITKENFILNAIKGYKAIFIEKPYQVFTPPPFKNENPEYKQNLFFVGTFVCEDTTTW